MIWLTVRIVQLFSLLTMMTAATTIRKNFVKMCKPGIGSLRRIAVIYNCFLRFQVAIQVLVLHSLVELVQLASSSSVVVTLPVCTKLHSHYDYIEILIHRLANA